ncbi:hypothetical protein EHP00_1160 [Ecytonucleospora hepatopenaei]|uniref:Uncharacterized protein n=1 Tax=Ecytonucleospora hepatopenaei TaxID=646526 RepID=A0A1W0E4D0_9MICR|nr:hypothetical protein EHP00_1160 [Ecytonucleospora hepatopenaei]
MFKIEKEIMFFDVSKIEAFINKYNLIKCNYNLLSNIKILRKCDYINAKKILNDTLKLKSEIKYLQIQLLHLKIYYFKIKAIETNYKHIKLISKNIEKCVNNEKILMYMSKTLFYLEKNILLGIKNNRTLHKWKESKILIDKLNIIE